MTSSNEVTTYVAAMLLILLKSQVSIAHRSSRDLEVDVAVSPPAPQLLFVRTRLQIAVVVTSVDNSTSCDDDHPTLLTMSVRSHRPTSVVTLSALSTDPANVTLVDVRFRLNQSAVIAVHAVSVGRALLTFEVSAAAADDDVDNEKTATNVDGRVRYKAPQVAENASGRHSADADAGGRRQQPVRVPGPSSHLLAVIEYHLTVARHRRPVDDGFFWTVATATLLNAFGLGCVTAYSDVRQELRKLRPAVLATVLCQFLVLPPVCCSAPIKCSVHK